jgi:hypothetical protein
MSKDIIKNKKELTFKQKPNQTMLLKVKDIGNPNDCRTWPAYMHLQGLHKVGVLQAYSLHTEEE